MSDTMSRRRRRAMSGDEREQAILETIEALLWERPLHDISIDDIARGAGISRPSFYFYFASKEAALFALYTQGGADFREQIGAIVDDLADDPPRMVERLTAATWDLWSERHPLLIAVNAATVTSPEIRTAWDAVMTGLVDQTASAIEAGRRRGTLPPGQLPAYDIAAALSLMVERVMHMTFAGRSPAPDRERTTATIAHIWLSALTAER